MKMIFSKKLWLLIAPLAVLLAGCNSSDSKNNEAPNPVGSTAVGAGPARVNLGTAGNFVILAKTAITNTPASAVTGDIGVGQSDVAATGFSLHLDNAHTFSISPQVTGKVYAADYAAPTPANLGTAISNMEAAYNDAAGRTAPNFTDLASGVIGGKTLVPGLYKWTGGVVISTDVTLKGGPDDVWIFQVAGGVVQSAGTRVLLTGGAKAKNIFWQTDGGVAMGSTAHMEGVILSKTGITLASGATANGRLLAQVGVALDTSTVIQPDSTVVTAPTPTPIPAPTPTPTPNPAKGPARVNLGTAGNFVVLAEASITNTPGSAVTGDIGATLEALITGFSLTLNTSGTFSTSTQVVGKVYAGDYAVPTPSIITAAVTDMTKAYADAAGRTTPDFTDLNNGLIGGNTLVPGLYNWSTGVVIATDVTLNGGPNDVWIFQITGGIVQNAGTRILLAGGAQAKNVFWQSVGGVVLGTTAHMEGIILSGDSIALGAGATAKGRLLTTLDVVLNTSTVTQP